MKVLRIVLTVLVSLLWGPWVFCIFYYSAGMPVWSTVLLEAIVLFFWIAFTSIIWMVE